MMKDILAVGTGHGPLPDRFMELSSDKPRLSSVIASATTGGKETVANSANYINDLEKISLIYDQKLHFMFDKKLGEVVVKILDGKTDKVIREIPPKELQDLHIKIRETIGILFDEKA